MGLRLAPLSAPVWVLVLLVSPETPEALHEELWPQEQRQVTIPRPVEPVSAPGGREPGEARHQPAGVGHPAASATKSLKTQPVSPGVPAGGPHPNTGWVTLRASSRLRTRRAIPLQSLP